MPTSGLIIRSPLLSPKGQQLMKHGTAAVLPVLLLSVFLLATSCEARGIPVHGKVRSSSNKSHRLPGKDVAATSLKLADGRLSRKMQAADAKVKEGMTKMAAASAGAVGATPRPAVTVSQRLSRKEDTGFHLDYAGPRTHTPSHN